MKPNLQTPKRSKQNSQYKHILSSDFKEILANQHNRQFHLIDHPDLVFQLANHNFNTNKTQQSIQRPKQSINKPLSSIQQRKYYRHKSQQQTNQPDYYLQSLLSNKKNTPQFLKNNVIDSFSASKENNKLFAKDLKMKKINFIKEKSVPNQEQQSVKLTLNSSPTQKQIIQSKILSLTRPFTSQSKFMPQKQPQINKKSWKQNFERKKYTQLKTKLSGLITQIENCENLKFSQVFEYEQVILRDYLSSLVTEMKKECMEKGQMIEMIWNTFLTLINKVMKLIVDEKKSVEKSQVQQQITLHQNYQQMYLFETTKIKQLGKKYNESKNVIDRLIYELRYKRKEVKKLSKNLAICNDKLNQYKVEHIDLQNQHIDLLIDAKQINQEQALQFLRRKLQVNRLKYLREKIGFNKHQLKFIIEQQLEDEKLNPQQEENFKKQLFQKINSNPIKKNKTAQVQNKQQTHLIEQFIEKFSSKFIEPPPQQNQNLTIQFVRKTQKAHTAINTDFDFTPQTQFTSSMTQTTFSDKIQFEIINTRSTQTPGAQKIKKTQTIAVQADGDQMRIVFLKSKMRVYRTSDLSFYFEIKKDSKYKRRNSSLLLKKQYQQNRSISQISSDHSQSKQKSTNNRTESKKSKKSTFDKKTSILSSTLQNYSNFRQQNNKYENGKKVNKKRVTQIPHIQHLKTQQSQLPKRQSKSKQRTYQSPSSFQQQKSNNRTSICMSNVDSYNGSISMNEEKQKYIENFIMSKDQQYEVLQQNAIMQTYKSYLKQKSHKKSSFFNESKKRIRTSQMTVDHMKDNFDSDFSQEQNSPSKQNLSSSDKIQQSGSLNTFKRSSKRASDILSSSVKKINNGNLQAQRRSIQQQYFLSKIIEFTVRKSLIKRKLDPSNFNQCKQKSQFVSISEKLDPFMLDVEYLMNQNLNRKRKNPQVNFKSVNKFIMMTYSRAIDKMYRNNYLLQNLIKPLYECFQIIYGALKPQQIYKKMVSAISDLLSVKQNQNFKEFIFFLGLDKLNKCTPYLTTFDVCIYLKLLEKLNLGGKFSSEIDTLYTSKSKVTAELTKILESQNLPHQIIKIIERKIASMLNKLQDYVRESTDSEGESKINLFKVSRIIVEEIIKIRIDTIDRLQFLISGLNKSKEQNEKETQQMKTLHLDCEKVKTVVDCCRISTTKKLYFNKIMEELSIKQLKENREEKKIKKSELGILLVRIGLVDFNQVEKRMKFVHENITKHHQNQNGQNQVSYSSIQKLYMVEVQSNQVVNQILGQISNLYQVGLLKTLQSLSHF